MHVAIHHGWVVVVRGGSGGRAAAAGGVLANFLNDRVRSRVNLNQMTWMLRRHAEESWGRTVTHYNVPQLMRSYWRGRMVLQFVVLSVIIAVRLIFVYTFGSGSSGQRQLLLQVIWLAARRLPVGSQSRSTDVLLITTLAYVRPIVGVESLVQLQVHKLGELLRAQIACVGFLAAV